MSTDQVEIRPEAMRAVASALANQRIMRNGSPPFANPLDLIQGNQKLLDEVFDDAKAAIEAWLKAQTEEKNKT